jgi:hypothetical protein
MAPPRRSGPTVWTLKQATNLNRRLVMPVVKVVFKGCLETLTTRTNQQKLQEPSEELYIIIFGCGRTDCQQSGLPLLPVSEVDDILSINTQAGSMNIRSTFQIEDDVVGNLNVGIMLYHDDFK